MNEEFMVNKPHEMSAQAIAQFNRRVFRRLAEKYGGECTLNEVRVMNQIICCHLEGRTCSVTALHEETGIPIPTVSRCVAKLHAEGWLSERQDPADGRKRIISLGLRSLNETLDDIRGSMRWWGDFRSHGVPT
jgi:DNA-binding MarR family transcriptional regulator